MKVRQIKQNSRMGSLVFLVALILIILNVKWFWLAFIILPFVKLLSRVRSKRKVPALVNP